MATMFRALALASLLILAPLAAPGMAAPRSIERGDPLRTVLLDVLRPSVEKDLGQKLVFVVDVLRVEGDWAFATVAPRTKAGALVDFSHTPHAERQRDGMLDGDTIYALLRRDRGQWRVKTWVIGPTDVTYAGWPEDYGAPHSLFGLPEPD